MPPDPATQITELAREAETLRRQLRDCEASKNRWIARAQEAEARVVELLKEGTKQ